MYVIAHINPLLIVDGDVIAHQYTVTGLLKEDESSILWRCEDIETEKGVALKFHKNQHSFNREMNILKQFNHHNIIELIELYPSNEQNEWHPYQLSVIPVCGRTLHDAYHHSRPVNVRQVRRMTRMMVDVLDVLQQHGVVHCDITPSNIALCDGYDEHGQWKLIGFDRACYVGEAVEHGTLEYCAPEAYQQAPASYSMDMFSVGRIMMWMSINDYSMWPDIPSNSTQQQFLLSEQEFTLTNIDDEATREIAQRLIKKKPQDRLTLDALKHTTFIVMD